MINPDDYPDDEMESVVDAAEAMVRAGKAHPTWSLGLPRNENGGFVRCLSVLLQVLERHPALQGTIAHDVRADQLRIVRDAPFAKIGPITDPVLNEMQAWMEEAADIKGQWGAEVIYRAVLTVGHRRAYDPVADYLRSLTWDGSPRISRLLIDHAGASDDALIESMTRAWLISAVQRALRPGCQADYVLVLESPGQGIYKTEFFRTLAGDGYHAEGQPAFGEKSASEGLQGPWIYELGELAGLSKHDSEAIKQFITQRNDRYRAPYARMATDHPRRMVFAGSTNQERYLKDMTGNRRYWPVRVKQIDIGAIAELRDQIWAEATTAALAGEPHWLRGDAERAAKEAQEQRLISEPWEEVLAGHIANREREGGQLVELTNHQIWDVLEIPIERRNGATGQKVAAIMKRLGWEPYRRKELRGFRRIG